MPLGPDNFNPSATTGQVSWFLHALAVGAAKVIRLCNGANVAPRIKDSRA